MMNLSPTSLFQFFFFLYAAVYCRVVCWCGYVYIYIYICIYDSEGALCSGRIHSADNSEVGAANEAQQPDATRSKPANGGGALQ
jgi:hypothetical protein